ncbi:Shedu immune nuclease family protein [Allomesorhizobium camelthorni]|uniref:DUF4263 domain-containing protein n=1 Tax=Allomesorhizobium camelthorni TaxID=475069 RepID=A0A6G4WKU5_9HYPH|nr:Shedu immune nuclease family protein [Mesorhizobium camelthorni]NGO55435.1 DUF4263 domain-containing protein [Mesorhizobium camelthorni]
MPVTARSGDEDTYSGKPIDAGTHPEDGSFLTLETIPDGKTQYLSYHISEKAYDRAKAAGADLEQVDESEPPPLLAEYCYSTRVLTTYPVWLRSNQGNFLRRKYGTIARISFEDRGHMEVDTGFGMFFDLPTGFHRKPFEGFGVDPRIKYLIDAFRNLPGIVGVTICDDDTISVDGEEVRLPALVFDDARLDITRAHDAARDFANGEKMAYLKNRFLPYIVPGYEPTEFERPGIDLRDTVRTALMKKGVPRSRNSNNSAAVRTVIREVDEIAKDDPVQLFELSEKIELVSLQVLIDAMTRAMSVGHLEGFWQKFFKANQFVFKLLFGLPVVMYVDQASVGGMGHHRHGEKYADFLVEAGASGNLAIVEIKAPGTPLMHPQAYRDPTLYRPHKDLAGGVNRVLEQRYNLVANIHTKRSIDDNIRINAWSVPCFLIIGTSPEDKWLRQSFELFRGNQREVVVITFDELLGKLKALHEFLSTKPPEADPNDGLV